MSFLRYGDIEFDLVRVNDFDQTAVMSEDGTEYKYTRATITADVVFTRDIDQGPAPKGRDIAKNFRAVSNLMMVPRQRLQVGLSKTGGDLILDVASGADMQAGPRCLAFKLRRIVGSRLMHCSITFECHFHACSNPPTILSHRWACSMELDRYGYTTRTFDGTLTIAPGSGPIVQQNADWFREYAFRAIPVGFNYDNGNFRTSEDGLTLRYTIRDKEQYIIAPFPAITIGGRYNESSPDGVKLTVSMEVVCTGAKNTPPRALLMAAARVVLGRVLRTDFVQSLSVEESFDENRVSISIVLWRGDAGQVLGKPRGNDIQPAVALIVNNDAFGKPLVGTRVNAQGTLIGLGNIQALGPNDKTFDVNYGRGFGVYGTAEVKAVSAAWRSAICAPPFGETPAIDPRPGPNGVIQFQAGRSYGFLETNDETRTTPEHREAPYLQYRLRTTIDTEGGEVQVPKSRKGQADDESSGGERPPTSVSFSIAQPMTRRTVEFRAERVGMKPALPLVEPRDGEKLLEKSFAFEAMLSPDMVGVLYICEGTAVFASNKQIDEMQDAIVTAIPPYAALTEDEVNYGPDDFQSGIVLT